MKSVTNPTDLYLDQLSDLHSMESQLDLSLPKLAPTAAHPQLRAILMKHAKESDTHARRLRGIFKKHGRPAHADKCKAIEGLISGGEAHLAAAREPHTRDLMMIAHFLRVEHYEIAAYGITGKLATSLGFREDAATLSDILAEEIRTARLLGDIQPEVFAAATAAAPS